MKLFVNTAMYALLYAFIKFVNRPTTTTTTTTTTTVSIILLLISRLTPSEQYRDLQTSCGHMLGYSFTLSSVACLITTTMGGPRWEFCVQGTIVNMLTRRIVSPEGETKTDMFRGEDS